MGRRSAYNAAILALFLCSIGTACSTNMKMFTAFRILAGFEGTYNMVAGQTIIADIFDPVGILISLPSSLPFTVTETDCHPRNAVVLL